MGTLSSSAWEPETTSNMLCVSLYVCVQNMCLWLSVCDLQQHTLVAVMSIQVVVVLKSSQLHTHSCTLSLCVWPDTCSPDVGRHSWRSHHTCGQFMSPHTILTLSQSTCRFVEPESSYEETTARLWERNTLTCNSSFSHLKAWKLWLKIGGCISNKYLFFFQLPLKRSSKSRCYGNILIQKLTESECSTINATFVAFIVLHL